LNRVARLVLSVSDIEALVVGSPRDVVVLELELLVGTSVVASPDLEMSAVVLVSVNHVEALVTTKGLDGTLLAVRVEPSAVTAGEDAEVGARSEHDLSAIGVGFGSQAEANSARDVDRLEVNTSSSRSGGRGGSTARDEILVTPNLVSLPVEASPELELDTIGSSTVGKVDTLVSADPLETTVRTVVELLVGASLDTIPELELGTVGVLTVLNVDTLGSARELDWLVARGLDFPVVSGGILVTTCVDSDLVPVVRARGAHTGLFRGQNLEGSRSDDSDECRENKKSGVHLERAEGFEQKAKGVVTVLI
jgi:hypothetical protein